MKINLHEAVSVHLLWIEQLRFAIANNKTESARNVICQSDDCDLGKWLSDEGNNIKPKTELDALRQKHDLFHLHASNISAKILINDMDGAHKLLNDELRITSSDLIAAIRNLRIAALKN